MANDISQLNTAGGASVNGDGPDYNMDKTISLATAATSDVIYIHKLLAGHRLVNVTCEVIEATGETATVSLGMASDLDGTLISSGTDFDASVNVNATAGTLTSGTGGTDASVTAGGYINLTPADTYLVAVPTVSASPLGALGQLRVVAHCRKETA